MFTIFLKKEEKVFKNNSQNVQYLLQCFKIITIFQDMSSNILVDAKSKAPDTIHTVILESPGHLREYTIWGHITYSYLLNNIVLN